MAKFLVRVVMSFLLTFWNSDGYCQADDEIQVLIDVSGSMKQNDPHNLRVDASKLLVSLLPDGGKTSIWLFAEKSNLLTQSEHIDAAWKQQAIKASNKIHSRGIFTHIEDAIDSALRNGFNGAGNKHLILLTDGMVDTSKDIMVSADSRERILSEWIPKLQQRQIKVQTIALSDQADKELLEKLAYETNGWTETVQSSDQLQHAFLKMMNKAAPKDTLPLADNNFQVDGSVKEFSAVVFKQDHAAPTQLIAPDGKAIDKHSTSVSWLEGQGYDLVTVKQPQAGNWRIDAAVDPNNQVMILTDLKLQIGELPNLVGDKQQLPLRIHFTEHDQLISRADFLQLVELSLSVDGQTPLVLKPSGSDPGYFATTLAEMAPGKHTLTLTADGKTFKRELQWEIEVLATAIPIETMIDSVTRSVTLIFKPDAAVLDPASLAITAQIHQPDKAVSSQSVSLKDGIWTLALGSIPTGSKLEVIFNVTAKTPDGKMISPTLAPVVIDDDDFLAQVGNQNAHHSETADVGVEHHAAEPEHEAVGANTEPAHETAWGMIIGLVIAANLIVAAIGFLVYKLLKKAHIAKQQQLLERLS